MYLNPNEMELIYGSEIKNISLLVPPYRRFWKRAKAKGYTKKGYKELIANSQEFFGMYIRGEECSDFRVPDGEGGAVRAIDVYCSIGNCVMAEKRKRGGYNIISGFHRAYVAKKFNMKLLVYVSE